MSEDASDAARSDLEANPRSSKHAEISGRNCRNTQNKRPHSQFANLSSCSCTAADSYTRYGGPHTAQMLHTQRCLVSFITYDLPCPCSTSSNEELQLLQTQAHDASAALAAWLEGHALQRWAGALTAAEVDLALLPHLTDSELLQVRQSLPSAHFQMGCHAATPVRERSSW